MNPIANVQSLSCVRLLVAPWTAACQAPLSSTTSWSLLKFMPIKLVMLSTHLILCCPLLLLPSIFPRIKIFSNESALRNTQPKYWSFSFSSSPSNEYSGLISFRTGLNSCCPRDSWDSSLVLQFKFFSSQSSSWSNSHIHTTGKTIALAIRTFVSKVMSLPRFVHIFPAKE